MTKAVKIEVQEGQTLDEAMAAMMASINPKKAPKKKEKKVTVSDPLTGASFPDADSIAAALHVYQRPGETDALTRLNGTRYRGDFGPSVLVFVHMHPVGKECVPACKERVSE